MSDENEWWRLESEREAILSDGWENLTPEARARLDYIDERLEGD